MVRLHDLDVVTGPELAYRARGDVREHVDAEAHVRGRQHGHDASGLVEHALARAVEARRAAHDGHARPHRELHESWKRRCGREVDHHVRAEEAGARVGADRDADGADAGDLADVASERGRLARLDRAHDRHTRVRGEARDRLPHPAARAADRDLHARPAPRRPSASAIWRRVASPAGTSGSRTVALILPSAASAALAGAGFGSRNMTRWRSRSAKWDSRAPRRSPARIRSVTRLTSAGRTFDVTLMTPLAPAAIIPSVSASSPLMTVSRSPRRA